MKSFIRSYQDTRKRTEDLCSPLETEDYVAQPKAFVSPPKWHLGHTTWFFEQFVLKKFKPEYKEYHPMYNYLFNSYYQSNGERVARPNRGHLTRPTVSEILKYRQFIDIQIIELLNTTEKDFSELMEIGINHEQQHQELLITDIKYILGTNPLFPVYSSTLFNENNSNKEQKWLTFEKGTHQIGNNNEQFCYDNETPVHTVYISEFQISDSLVTNKEFLEFIKAGGYDDFTLWHDDGWAWITENKIKAPLFWHKTDKDWKTYQLSGLSELVPDHPVTHISYYEAYAFAAWKNCRLPTEQEWEIASSEFDWGLRWEWTESAYLPYPGYQRPEGAIGEYNGKFMVNQKVLRGASIATPKGHSRKTYRNFFHPNERWQFTGIRLAKNIK